jgi:hypothetical protein
MRSKVTGIILVSVIMIAAIWLYQDDKNKKRSNSEKPAEIVSAVSNNDSTKEKDLNENTKKEKDVEPNQQKKIALVQKNESRNLKMESYEISHPSCPVNSLISPEYLDKNNIIYVDYGDEVTSLVKYSIKTDRCEVLYDTKVGIGSITGLEGNLYWSEYNTSEIADVDWVINNLPVNGQRKVEVIKKGSSNDGTPPPTLKVNEEKNILTWIEYAKEGTKLTSSIYSYSNQTSETDVLMERTLKEDTDTRDGKYLISQTTGETGQIFYESVYKNNEKTFNLGMHSADSERSFLKQKGIIDFSSNADILVTSGEGYLDIVDLSQDLTLTYSNQDRLTLDSPVFINKEKVIFRYGMNKLYMANIKEKSYSPITDYYELLSKPKKFNDLIAYATRSGDKSFTFNVIHVKPN